MKALKRTVALMLAVFTVFTSSNIEALAAVDYATEGMAPIAASQTIITGSGSNACVMPRQCHLGFLNSVYVQWDYQDGVENVDIDTVMNIYNDVLDKVTTYTAGKANTFSYFKTISDYKAALPVFLAGRTEKNWNNYYSYYKNSLSKQYGLYDYVMNGLVLQKVYSSDKSSVNYKFCESIISWSDMNKPFGSSVETVYPVGYGWDDDCEQFLLEQYKKRSSNLYRTFKVSIVYDEAKGKYEYQLNETNSASVSVNNPTGKWPAEQGEFSAITTFRWGVYQGDAGRFSDLAGNFVMGEDGNVTYALTQDLVVKGSNLESAHKPVSLLAKTGSILDFHFGNEIIYKTGVDWLKSYWTGSLGPMRQRLTLEAKDRLQDDREVITGGFEARAELDKDTKNEKGEGHDYYYNDLRIYVMGARYPMIYMACGLLYPQRYMSFSGGLADLQEQIKSAPTERLSASAKEIAWAVYQKRDASYLADGLFWKMSGTAWEPYGISQMWKKESSGLTDIQHANAGRWLSSAYLTYRKGASESLSSLKGAGSGLSAFGFDWYPNVENSGKSSWNDGKNSSLGVVGIAYNDGKLSTNNAVYPYRFLVTNVSFSAEAKGVAANTSDEGIKVEDGVIKIPVTLDTNSLSYQVAPWVSQANFDIVIDLYSGSGNSAVSAFNDVVDFDKVKVSVKNDDGTTTAEVGASVVKVAYSHSNNTLHKGASLRIDMGDRLQWKSPLQEDSSKNTDYIWDNYKNSIYEVVVELPTSVLNDFPPGTGINCRVATVCEDTNAADLFPDKNMSDWSKKYPESDWVSYGTITGFSSWAGNSSYNGGSGPDPNPVAFTVEGNSVTVSVAESAVKTDDEKFNAQAIDMIAKLAEDKDTGAVLSASMIDALNQASSKDKDDVYVIYSVDVVPEGDSKDTYTISDITLKNDKVYVLKESTDKAKLDMAKEFATNDTILVARVSGGAYNTLKDYLEKSSDITYKVNKSPAENANFKTTVTISIVTIEDGVAKNNVIATGTANATVVSNSKQTGSANPINFTVNTGKTTSKVESNFSSPAQYIAAFDVVKVDDTNLNTFLSKAKDTTFTIKVTATNSAGDSLSPTGTVSGWTSNGTTWMCTAATKAKLKSVLGSVSTLMFKGSSDVTSISKETVKAVVTIEYTSTAGNKTTTTPKDATAEISIAGIQGVYEFTFKVVSDGSMNPTQMYASEFINAKIEPTLDSTGVTKVLEKLATMYGKDIKYIVSFTLPEDSDFSELQVKVGDTYADKSSIEVSYTELETALKNGKIGAQFVINKLTNSEFKQDPGIAQWSVSPSTNDKLQYVLGKDTEWFSVSSDITVENPFTLEFVNTDTKTMATIPSDNFIQWTYLKLGKVDDAKFKAWYDATNASQNVSIEIELKSSLGDDVEFKTDGHMANASISGSLLTISGSRDVIKLIVNGTEYIDVSVGIDTLSKLMNNDMTATGVVKYKDIAGKGKSLDLPKATGTYAIIETSPVLKFTLDASLYKVEGGGTAFSSDKIYAELVPNMPSGFESVIDNIDKVIQPQGGTGKVQILVNVKSGGTAGIDYGTPSVVIDGTEHKANNGIVEFTWAELKRALKDEEVTLILPISKPQDSTYMDLPNVSFAVVSYGLKQHKFIVGTEGEWFSVTEPGVAQSPFTVEFDSTVGNPIEAAFPASDITHPIKLTIKGISSAEVNNWLGTVKGDSWEMSLNLLSNFEGELVSTGVTCTGANLKYDAATKSIKGTVTRNEIKNLADSGQIILNFSWNITEELKDGGTPNSITAIVKNTYTHVTDKPVTDESVPVKGNYAFETPSPYLEFKYNFVPKDDTLTALDLFKAKEIVYKVSITELDASALNTVISALNSKYTGTWDIDFNYTAQTGIAINKDSMSAIALNTVSSNLKNNTLEFELTVTKPENTTFTLGQNPTIDIHPTGKKSLQHIRGVLADTLSVGEPTPPVFPFVVVPEKNEYEVETGFPAKDIEQEIKLKLVIGKDANDKELFTNWVNSMDADTPVTIYFATDGLWSSNMTGSKVIGVTSSNAKFRLATGTIGFYATVSIADLKTMFPTSDSFVEFTLKTTSPEVTGVATNELIIKANAKGKLVTGADFDGGNEGKVNVKYIGVSPVINFSYDCVAIDSSPIAMYKATDVKGKLAINWDANGELSKFLTEGATKLKDLSFNINFSIKHPDGSEFKYKDVYVTINGTKVTGPVTWAQLKSAIENNKLEAFFTLTKKEYQIYVDQRPTANFTITLSTDEKKVYGKGNLGTPLIIEEPKLVAPPLTLVVTTYPQKVSVEMPSEANYLAMVELKCLPENQAAFEEWLTLVDFTAEVPSTHKLSCSGIAADKVVPLNAGGLLASKYTAGGSGGAFYAKGIKGEADWKSFCSGGITFFTNVGTPVLYTDTMITNIAMVTLHVNSKTGTQNETFTWTAQCDTEIKDEPVMQVPWEWHSKVSTPFAELVATLPGEANNKWDVNSGIPSTETLCLVAGGDLFRIDLAGQYRVIGTQGLKTSNSLYLNNGKKDNQVNPSAGLNRVVKFVVNITDDWGSTENPPCSLSCSGHNVGSGSKSQSSPSMGSTSGSVTSPGNGGSKDFTIKHNCPGWEYTCPGCGEYIKHDAHVVEKNISAKDTETKHYDKDDKYTHSTYSSNTTTGSASCTWSWSHSCSWSATFYCNKLDDASNCVTVTTGGASANNISVSASANTYNQHLNLSGGSFELKGPNAKGGVSYNFNSCINNTLIDKGYTVGAGCKCSSTRNCAHPKTETVSPCTIIETVDMIAFSEIFDAAISAMAGVEIFDTDENVITVDDVALGTIGHEGRAAIASDSYVEMWRASTAEAEELAELSNTGRVWFTQYRQATAAPGGCSTKITSDYWLECNQITITITVPANKKQALEALGLNTIGYIPNNNGSTENHFQATENSNNTEYKTGYKGDWLLPEERVKLAKHVVNHWQAINTGEYYVNTISDTMQLKVGDITQVISSHVAKNVGIPNMYSCPFLDEDSVIVYNHSCGYEKRSQLLGTFTAGDHEYKNVDQSGGGMYKKGYLGIDTIDDSKYIELGKISSIAPLDMLMDASNGSAGGLYRIGGNGHLTNGATSLNGFDYGAANGEYGYMYAELKTTAGDYVVVKETHGEYVIPENATISVYRSMDGQTEELLRGGNYAAIASDVGAEFVPGTEMAIPGITMNAHELANGVYSDVVKARLVYVPMFECGDYTALDGTEVCKYTNSSSSPYVNDIVINDPVGVEGFIIPNNTGKLDDVIYNVDESKEDYRYSSEGLAEDEKKPYVVIGNTFHLWVTNIIDHESAGGRISDLSPNQWGGGDAVDIETGLFYDDDTIINGDSYGYSTVFNNENWVQKNTVTFEFPVYYTTKTGVVKLAPANEEIDLSTVKFEYYGYGIDTLQDAMEDRAVCGWDYKFEVANSAIENPAAIIKVRAYAKNKNVSVLTKNDTRVGETSNTLYLGDDIDLPYIAESTSTIEIVGRIGDIAITDTQDYKYSNLFRVPASDWLIDGAVHNVTNESNNQVRTPINLFGLNTLNAFGAINKDLLSKVGLLNIDDASVSFPLSSDKNNLLEFSEKHVSAGYAVYASISTLGEYSGKNTTVGPTSVEEDIQFYDEETGFNTTDLRTNYMQIDPHYVLYDPDDGKFYEVDLYCGTEGSYELFWSDKSEIYTATNALFTDLTDATNRGRFGISDFAYEYAKQFGHMNDYTAFTAKDYVGSASRIILDQRNNFVIGTKFATSVPSYFDTTSFFFTDNSVVSRSSMALSRGEADFDFVNNARRWVFSVGLPSSVLPTYCSPGNTQFAIVQSNEQLRNDHPNGVLVCFLDILARGKTYTLRYDFLRQNGTSVVQIGNDFVNLAEQVVYTSENNESYQISTKWLPFAVFDYENTSTSDTTIGGSH